MKILYTLQVLQRVHTILKARGVPMTQKDVADEANVPLHHIMSYLQTLENLKLVERVEMSNSGGTRFKWRYPVD